jgi:hypothetical protein
MNQSSKKKKTINMLMAYVLGSFGLLYLCVFTLFLIKFG